MIFLHEILTHYVGYFCKIFACVGLSKLSSASQKSSYQNNSWVHTFLSKYPRILTAHIARYWLVEGKIEELMLQSFWHNIWPKILRRNRFQIFDCWYATSEYPPTQVKNNAHHGIQHCYSVLIILFFIFHCLLCRKTGKFANNNLHISRSSVICGWILNNKVRVLKVN